MATLNTDEIQKLLEAQIKSSLAPQDTAAQMATEKARIDAEANAAILNATRTAKSQAAQRGGLESGGLTEDIVSQVTNVDLKKAQLTSDAQKKINEEQTAKTNAGVSAGLNLQQIMMQQSEAEKNRQQTAALQTQSEAATAERQAKEIAAQKEQADLQRKYLTGERIGTQTFQKEEQERQMVFQTGERTATEAWTAAQTKLQQTWTAAQAKVKMDWDEKITKYSEEQTNARQQIALAAAAGDTDKKLAWEQYAANLESNTKKALQSEVLLAQQNQFKAQQAYQETIDGKIGSDGKYIPGIKSLQAQLDNAFTAGESEKERDLKLEIEQLKLQAQQHQDDATAEASRGEATGKLLGTVGGAIGTAVGGPIGAAVGTLAGTLLGNLFG